MSLHILVISDNGSFAAHLCQLLAAAGHAATTAPEGKHVFRAIHVEKPELIVIAVEAAKVADLAIEQRLHTPEGPRIIPVIVISNCLRLEAELLHIFDFIPKPLDVERLLNDVAAIAEKPAHPGRHAALSDQRYQEFSGHILSCTGLHFDARNRSALKRGIGKRMSALRMECCTQYLAYLKRHGENRHELQKLLQFLTVGETYFFRYPSHFDALRERLHSRHPHPAEPIRIWSAGCSTGEEPYSIAISVMEAIPDWRDRDIKVIATDINNRSIKLARDGVYSPWSMRTTGLRHLERYFDRDGKNFLIRDEVKRLVQFSHLNLSAPRSGEICDELQELDAIFCRNVLIYFSPEPAARMVGNLAAALKTSGQLFLGHAEPLFQRSPDLEIRRHGNSFYYVRSSHRQPERHHSASPEQLRALHALPPARQQDAPATRLKAAQQLFDAEEFGAARDLIDSLLDECPQDTGALLLRGFILAGEGHLQQALDTCRRVIALNDLLPEPYFLKGVVLEASGLPEEAAREYRKALLLDHDFIMPRFHMGRLHLRLGRMRDAAREIRNSITILAKRGDQGCIPFSGGLTRELCLSQLQNTLAQVG